MGKLDLTKKLSKAEKKQDKKPKKTDHPLVKGFENQAKKVVQIKNAKKLLDSMLKVIAEELKQAAFEFRIKNKVSGTIEFTGPKGNVQCQEVSKYTTKIGIDSDEDKELQKLVGKKNYENWFEIRRELKISDEFLADEAKLEKLVDLIDSEFGMEAFEVKQWVYPKVKPADLFQNERYSALKAGVQVEVNDILSVQHKIA